MISETSKKPAEQFNILVVPRNNSNVKRFKLSHRMVHIGVGAAFLFTALVIASVSSLLYYRHAYIATEDVRVMAADFARERAELIGKISELEASVSRTERFTAKIESAVGGTDEELNGKGPLDEEDVLPAPDSVSARRGADGVGVWKSPFSKGLNADLNFKIDELMARSEDVEGKVHELFAKQQDKLFFWASLPSIQPSRGLLTSDFGERRGRRMHEGIDLAAPRGTPIVAPGDGVVTFSGYYHGYGQMVTVDHGGGISTLFAHCSAMYVSEGERIKRGTLIASVGNTGSSTGPHLHYEVHRDGVPVNPKLYIMR